MKCFNVFQVVKAIGKMAKKLEFEMQPQVRVHLQSHFV